MIEYCKCGSQRIDHSRDYNTIGTFTCNLCIVEEALHGQYRRPTATDQRSADQAPSDAGGGLTKTGLPSATWRTLNTGQVTYADPSLTIAKYADLMRDYIDQQMFRAALYSTGPAVFGLDLAREIPPRPPLTREMKVGEIVGYRCWNLTDDYLLRSVHMNETVWQPHQTLTSEIEPADWDSRGIHCWKSKRSDRFASYIESEDCVYIVGSIYLWGDVVEHEYGYRGEYASVRSIDRVTLSETDEDIFGREDALLRLLHRKYGVD